MARGPALLGQGPGPGGLLERQDLGVDVPPLVGLGQELVDRAQVVDVLLDLALVDDVAGDGRRSSLVLEALRGFGRATRTGVVRHAPSSHRSIAAVRATMNPVRGPLGLTIAIVSLWAPRRARSSSSSTTSRRRRRERAPDDSSRRPRRGRARLGADAPDASADVVVPHPKEAGPAPDHYAPCSGLASGYYCADDGPHGFAGPLSDLLFCDDGGIGEATPCDGGCLKLPAPFPDACNPCPGVADGLYCGRDLAGFPAYNADFLIQCQQRQHRPAGRVSPRVRFSREDVGLLSVTAAELGWVRAEHTAPAAQQDAVQPPAERARLRSGPGGAARRRGVARRRRGRPHRHRRRRGARAAGRRAVRGGRRGRRPARGRRARPARAPSAAHPAAVPQGPARRGAGLGAARGLRGRRMGDAPRAREHGDGAAASTRPHGRPGAQGHAHRLQRRSAAGSRRDARRAHAPASGLRPAAPVARGQRPDREARSEDALAGARGPHPPGPVGEPAERGALHVSRRGERRLRRQRQPRRRGRRGRPGSSSARPVRFEIKTGVCRGVQCATVASRATSSRRCGPSATATASAWSSSGPTSASATRRAR